MIILLLLLIPVGSGLAAFAVKTDPPRRWLLLGTAVAHSLLTLLAWVARPGPILGRWFALDATGLLFLTIASILFLASAFYIVGYLARERRVTHVDTVESLLFSNEPESVFVGCLLMFLASMTLVAISQHFGMIWVAIEATTLATGPLIYFHRHHRSLEAAWKYLLICSVGIAMALMGNFLLAASHSTGAPSSEGIGLFLADLIRDPHHLNIAWLKAAFLFLLVGYGTKMGLAPMHNWLPDAYSEAPSAVGALLSGALSNMAFLGLLRGYQVCLAAGIGPFAQELLVVFGLLSMGVAAVFIVRQSDYKRMLAYSSVEHTGILALGIGLGGVGAFGTALHALGNSLVKGALFLIAGNILACYHTKSVSEIRGISRSLPITGVLWVAGFLAVTGSPPFSPFLSEFTILKAALDQGHSLVALLYLLFLAVVFIGMANIVLPMAQGRSSLAAEAMPTTSEALWSTLPPAFLGLLALGMGVYIPPIVNDVLREVALALGGVS